MSTGEIAWRLAGLSGIEVSPDPAGAVTDADVDDRENRTLEAFFILLFSISGQNPRKGTDPQRCDPWPPPGPSLRGGEFIGLLAGASRGHRFPAADLEQAVEPPPSLKRLLPVFDRTAKERTMGSRERALARRPVRPPVRPTHRQGERSNAIDRPTGPGMSDSPADASTRRDRLSDGDVSIQNPADTDVFDDPERHVPSKAVIEAEWNRPKFVKK